MPSDTDYAHRANRNNPLIGRGPRRGVSYDKETMQPRYCICSNCGNRSIAKVGVDCSAVPCMKCRKPMVG